MVMKRWFGETGRLAFFMCDDRFSRVFKEWLKGWIEEGDRERSHWPWSNRTVVRECLKTGMVDGIVRLDGNRNGFDGRGFGGRMLFGHIFRSLLLLTPPFSRPAHLFLHRVVAVEVVFPTS